MKTPLLCGLTLLFALGSIPARAGTITNNFDDLFNVPLNGLSDRGVLFNFYLEGLPSSTALYGLSFPSDSLIGSTVISGPAGNSIPGPTGLLSLSFANPTDYLSFEIAFDSSSTDTFKLWLFDVANNPQAPVPITTTVDPNCDPNVSTCFSEAQYVYSGSNRISLAQLAFNNTQADTFALSTLVYSEAPEPGSAWSMAGGLVVLLVAARWRYRAKLVRSNGTN